VEYQQIAAAWSSPLPVRMSFLRVFWNGAGAGPGGFVFGTLLGPEATGPGVLRSLAAVVPGLVFLVSWRRRSCTCVCGVWCTGLLFENYIVDASIFYKKQFPRI
jgi:hypothetical protein